MTPNIRQTCQAPVKNASGEICKCGVVAFLGSKYCWVHAELPKAPQAAPGQVVRVG